MHTNLYIIRHGEAICNVEGYYGGRQGCRGLTDRGLAQAARLAQRLARGEILVDAFYASPLPRARQTAETAARALGVDVRWDRELEERRPGEADGLSYSEVDQRFGPFSMARPYHARAPQEESVASFLTRAGSALDRLIRQHEGQAIMVVAHGGIVEASFSLLLGLTPHLLRQTGIHTSHTGITHWRLNPAYQAGEPPRWALMRHNDVAHLTGLEEIGRANHDDTTPK